MNDFIKKKVGTTTQTINFTYMGQDIGATSLIKIYPLDPKEENATLGITNEIID